tara:strand:+ start:80 stop:1243 length:1164 start_codon:yes stop_codon:yes gene_type:complete
MIRYITITLISIITSLYCFEFYLNYLENLPSKKKIKIYQSQTGKEFDTRNKIEVFLDLRKKYSNLTSTIVPKWYAIHQKTDLLPLSGLSNTLTLHCNENGYYTLFKSDRYGFNNPDDQWDKDNIEFFIVGDSFAMGECVNRPYDFGSVLRTISNKASLNLGYSSNGPNIQYAVMREYLDKRVKNILWMYYEGNDLQDMLDTLDNSKIINNYLNDLKFSQNLKSKQNKLDELNDINIKKQLDYHQERERRRTKYQTLRFIRLDKTKDTLKKIIKPEEENTFNKNDYLKFKNVLNLSKTLAKENGSKIYFIYLPSYKRLKGSSSKEENSQKKQVLSIVKDLDINLIDIEVEILSKKIEYLKIFPFGMYGHYNIDGYRIISNIIYDKIMN